MNLFDQDDIRLIRMAISSARRSFDSVNRTSKPGPKLDDVRAQYLRFEGVRFRYDSAISSMASQRSETLTSEVLSDFSAKLAELVSDNEFFRVTNTIRYRTLSAPSRTPVVENYSALFDREEKISLAEAILQIADYMSDIIPQGDLFTSAEGLRRLGSFLPEQKVSPIQFDIRDGRLAVANVSSTPAAVSAELVAPARSELLVRGESLITQLKGSNCDPRLLKEVQQLQDSLSAQKNVIQIGLSALSCGLLHQTFQSELPDAISALLRSHTVGINMYLQQFPDWTLFSRSSESVVVDALDAAKLAKSLDLVILVTSDEPKISSPEVPETLKYLRLLLGDPAQASSKAILATIRTLENLAIKVFSYGTQLVDKTITKSIEGLSSTAAKIIVASFLGLGVGAASGLIPVAPSVEGLGWVRDAVTIAQKEIALFTASSP
ncbi:MAG: hypothetical protein ACOH2N_06220 [Devosia sp.]